MLLKTRSLLTDINNMETQLSENECAEHTMNGQEDFQSGDRAGIKKCPFCAEQIRQEAIKCRFCGEFLEGRSRVESRRPFGKWSFSTGVTVIALLCLGPIALPMVWLNRRYKPVTKVIISIVVLVVTIICVYWAVALYRQLYAELGIFEM